MSGTTPTNENMNLQKNPYSIWPGWTREYPALETQPDGSIWLPRHGIRFQDEAGRPPFYPLKLLEHLFTEQVLSSEINALNGLTATKRDDLVKQVLGSSGTVPETYIKVFAILKAISKLSQLPEFIRKGVSDQELPLDVDWMPVGGRLSYGKSKKPVPDELLDEIGRRSFSMEQHNMLIPFFDLQAEPYDLNRATPLPYYEIPQTTSAESNPLVGGYGLVSKVLIHPLCHEFHGVFATLQVSWLNF